MTLVNKTSLEDLSKCIIISGECMTQCPIRYPLFCVLCLSFMAIFFKLWPCSKVESYFDWVCRFALFSCSFCYNVFWFSFQITDIQFFFMILAVFVLSFGVTYQANLFPNSEASWKLLKDIVYIPYWQMYGELFLENIEGLCTSLFLSLCSYYLSKKME